MPTREEYLQQVRNANPTVRVNGRLRTMYRVLYDTDFLKQKINVEDDISNNTERTIHAHGYWAKCMFTTDGHYNIPEECPALLRFSYGTSTNAISALAIKLFYNNRTYDIISNNFNISRTMDFHSAFRTNVFFENAPYSTAVVRKMLIRSFNETGKNPIIFDLQHLVLDSDKSLTDSEEINGAPETLFFKYGGSAMRIDEIQKGDILDIHSGDGISVGRKIGVISLEENVYQDVQLDNTVIFRHHLRKLTGSIRTRRRFKILKTLSYIGDITSTATKRYISLDSKLSSLYNRLYLSIKPKDPDARESFPSSVQELPIGMEEIDSGIEVPIPYDTNMKERSIMLRCMKLFNKLPFIKSDIATNSERSQVGINYLLCKKAVENFLLEGPGLSTLTPCHNIVSNISSLMANYSNNEESLERMIITDNVDGRSWKADLTHYLKYNVRKGYQKYGCCIYTDGKIITSITVPIEMINNEETIEYRWVNLPADDLYALRVAYATLVMHVTISQHLSLDHLTFANNLALYTENTYNGDFFSKFGKLASFGTFSINYDGAPILLLPGGVFDRLFAYTHRDMISIMSASDDTDAELEKGVYTVDKLNSLPDTNLAVTLRNLLTGPYLKLARTIVCKSPGRDWSTFITERIRKIVKSDDITLILAVHLLHVTVDHYLVGRLETHVSSPGFRCTIPKLGNIDVSLQELGLINLTLQLTYRESLDMCNDMSPYFASLPEAGEIWAEFASLVRNIAEQSNICAEQIATSIDI
ncbi:Hypothetical protein HVR_LOCUS467 [uncultured virus]|nr:Hypothetical protein HVR_LOCUS467 [uncultured virus]